MNFSTKQVAELSGLSYRQVDHWAGRGYLPGHEHGPGHGKYRRFTPEQTLRVMSLAALVEAGFDIRVASAVPFSSLGTPLVRVILDEDALRERLRAFDGANRAEVEEDDEDPATWTGSSVLPAQVGV